MFQKVNFMQKTDRETEKRKKSWKMLEFLIVT